jgi:hypothetical protein
MTICVKKTILVGAMMAAVSSSVALASDSFKSLVCFEDGYTASSVELKAIGDQLVLELASPFVGAQHPQIQIDTFNFNVPLEGCKFDAQLPGVLQCAAQNGEVNTKTGRARYQSFSYDQLLLKVSPFVTRDGKPGRTFTIQVSGGEVSPAFNHTLTYETKIPDGPIGITSYCVLNGETLIDRK